MRNSLMLLVLAGCAKPVVIDGHKLYQFHYDDMRTQVETNAKFLLECEEVKLTVLTSTGRIPDDVGVQGCDQQRVYVRVPGTMKWVVND